MGVGVPEAPRPLGVVGAGMWESVWVSASWLDPESDLQAVLVLCETLDERVVLRDRVLQAMDWRERAGLRALDEQVSQAMDALGLTPRSRSRLAVAVQESPFDELARRKARR